MLYSSLKRPSQLATGTFLQLFIDGVKPMWEDEANKEGGRWAIRVQKGYADTMWENLVLALIGEAFDPPDEVVGLMISVRQY